MSMDVMATLQQQGKPLTMETLLRLVDASDPANQLFEKLEVYHQVKVVAAKSGKIEFFTTSTSQNVRAKSDDAKGSVPGGFEWVLDGIRVLLPEQTTPANAADFFEISKLILKVKNKEVRKSLLAGWQPGESATGYERMLRTGLVKIEENASYQVDIELPRALRTSTPIYPTVILNIFALDINRAKAVKLRK